VYVRIPSVRFRRVIDSLIAGSSISVNLSVHNGKLQVQNYKNIVINKYIDILEKDCDDFDITVNIDLTYRLLNVEKDMTLTLVGDVLELSQDEFSYRTEREPNDKVVIEPKGDYTEYTILRTELHQLCNHLRAVENANKEIAMDSPVIDIKDGFAYVKGQDMITKTPVSFPDAQISVEVVKSLYKCMGNQVKARFYSQSNLLIVDLGYEDNAFVDVRPYSPDRVDLADRMSRKAVKVTDMSIKKYIDTIDVLSSVYKKTKITLGVGQKDLLLQVNSVNSNIQLGMGSQILVSIYITSGQLKAVSQLLSEHEEIEFRKGDNLLCLMPKNSKQALMLAGITF